MTVILLEYTIKSTKHFESIWTRPTEFIKITTDWLAIDYDGQIVILKASSFGILLTQDVDFVEAIQLLKHDEGQNGVGPQPSKGDTHF